MIWEFVLRFWKRSGERVRARGWSHTTLTRMARGGMYDQLGGGFHRYSVDAHWLVPHFEKMLYDNAQLASLYLRRLARRSAIPSTGASCEETLDYVLREMTDPAGGFYSAEDADSEGDEGKFYVWTPDEIRAVLGADADRSRSPTGTCDRGPQLRGQEHPRPLAGEPRCRRAHRGRCAAALLEARERARASRPRRQGARRPGTACMLRALAEAGRALGRADYVGRGRPQRGVPARARCAATAGCCARGRPARRKLNGYLEDYATGRRGARRRLRGDVRARAGSTRARELADDMLRLFWDDEHRRLLRHRPATTSG